MTKLPIGYCAHWSERISIGNLRPRTAIILPKSWNSYIVTQHSHTDYVTICIESVRLSIISLYCSDEKDMVKSWDEVVKENVYIRRGIICADVNAYHVLWGSNIERNQKYRGRKRGRELVELLDENHFDIYNIVPHKATFVRNEGSVSKDKNVSYINATFCMGDMQQYISEWRVCDELFMSDHRSIRFQVNSKVDSEKRVPNEALTPWKKPSDKMLGIMKSRLGKGVRYKRRINGIKDIDTFINKHCEQIRCILENIFKKGENKKDSRKVFWWMEEVRECHMELKKARRRMRRYRHEDLRNIFNNCRSKFRKAIERAKAEAWRTFTSNISNPWDGIVKIVRATSVGRSNNRILSDIEGFYAHDMKQTLVLLGRQFFPAPLPMNNSHRMIENRVEQKLREGDGISFNDITKCELIKAMHDMLIATAPGFDQITNNAIQIMINDAAFTSMYLKLFNMCLKKEYFPKEWKKSKIVLIPKATTTLDSVKAFRLISLTSAFSKLLERIVLARISHYLETSGSMTENQHAYRKGKSTLTTLYELFEVVQYAVNRKEVCVIVFLDISGAFDKTWHHGILDKLLEYGVPVYFVSWMKSFLSGRTAFFEAAAEVHEVPLKQGCRQDGVLSPALWNVLFNDMLSIPVEGNKHRGNCIKVVDYTDDAAVVCKAPNITIASNLLNAHLAKIYKWSVENRVQFNTLKLAVMTITTRPLRPAIKRAKYVDKKNGRKKQVDKSTQGIF